MLESQEKKRTILGENLEEKTDEEQIREEKLRKKFQEELISDVNVYAKKKITFDAFRGEVGKICLHLTGEINAAEANLVYVLYDRGSESSYCELVPNYKEGWLSLSGYGAMTEGYEDGVQRYTIAAMDKERRTLYVFSYKKDVKKNEYDKMESLLFCEPMGEDAEREKLEALFYLADEDKILRVILQKKYGRLKNFLSGYVKHISLKRGCLILKWQLQDYGYVPLRVYMQLRSKTELRQYDFDLKVEKKSGVYMATAKLLLNECELAQFYWDIKGEVGGNDFVFDLEIKNRDLWFHRLLYLRQLHYDDVDGNRVFPYKTKSNQLAVEFRPKTEQDNWGFIFKEYVALFCYYLLRPWLKRKKIWLVYEKYCVMAQDNGFYFFKYCMEQVSEDERRRIYYVIDKKAADYAYVKKYEPQVIDFLSLKHMIYLMSAELLVSSDTRAHAYAWHSPSSVYRNMLKRKKNVFLQHGVIAFKCCHQGLKKKSVNASDLFVVSSEVEKQIILDNFGYTGDEILVTGLARWDVLEDKSAGEPLQIVLMPTWRRWLEEVSEEEFVASDYYRHYMALLNSEELLNVLEKYGIQLNFYIHPKFREYIGAFQASGENIRLIPFGTEPLNELMMRCSMMITDYSSAVWDVFYQGKPVAFYLFDLEMYNEIEGSYIDMETEAFGDVAHTPKELAKLICTYAENGFAEKEQYRRMRKTQIAYIDDRNSARTYQEIIRRYPFAGN